MSRASRSHDSNGIELFPFLAVLLCTLGALVLLLVLLGRQARTDAAREEARAADQAPLAAAGEELRWQIEHLRGSRDKTARDLAEQRQQLAHLEDHIRRLIDHLEASERAVADLKAAAAGQTPAAEALRAELADIQRQTIEVEGELAEAAQRPRRGSSYAIIPYQGPNDTRRRPLYLECRADSVILQPEGIVFYPRDFLGPLGPSNPLAAALRTASEYLVTSNPAAPGAEGEPYPLLVVRPSGIEAYHAARAAMSSWDSDFGYELVEESWELKYPPVDQRLAQAVQNTVDLARQEQEALLAMLAQSGGGGRRAVYRAAPTGGGLVRDDLGPGGGRGGARVGKSLSDEGPEDLVTAFASRPSGGGGGGLGGPGGAAATAGGGPARSGTTRGSGGSDWGSVAGGEPSAGGSSRGGAGAGSTVFGETSDFGRTAGGGPRGASGRGAGDASGGEGAAGDGPGGPNAEGSEGAALAAGGTGGTSATPGAAGSQGGSSPTPGGGASSGGDGSGGAGSMAGGGGSSAGSSGSPGGPASRSASGSPAATENASAMMDLSQPPAGSAADSLARSRGRDWGLPSSARGSVPITRPISILCEAEQLTIRGEDGRSRPGQTIAVGPSTTAAVDALVSGVWSEVDRWGMAGRGMHWRPILSFEIAPGGEARFAELARLLADSGLEVRGRGTRAAQAPAGRAAPVR